jgi:hypothetical protein
MVLVGLLSYFYTSYCLFILHIYYLPISYNPYFVTLTNLAYSLVSE